MMQLDVKPYKHTHWEVTKFLSLEASHSRSVSIVDDVKKLSLPTVCIVTKPKIWLL